MTRRLYGLQDKHLLKAVFLAAFNSFQQVPVFLSHVRLFFRFERRVGGWLTGHSPFIAPQCISSVTMDKERPPAANRATVEEEPHSDPMPVDNDNNNENDVPTREDIDLLLERGHDPLVLNRATDAEIVRQARLARFSGAPQAIGQQGPGLSSPPSVPAPNGAVLALAAPVLADNGANPGATGVRATLPGSRHSSVERHRARQPIRATMASEPRHRSRHREQRRAERPQRDEEEDEEDEMAARLAAAHRRGKFERDYRKINKHRKDLIRAEKGKTREELRDEHNARRAKPQTERLPALRDLMNDDYDRGGFDEFKLYCCFPLKGEDGGPYFCRNKNLIICNVNGFQFALCKTHKNKCETQARTQECSILQLELIRDFFTIIREMHQQLNIAPPF